MSKMSNGAAPPSTIAGDGPRPGPRVLFLDDDPNRAAAFLADNPDAIWVETVDDCLARLEEPWDEVHLDHDLGGEVFVDCGREDCGMAIVRWLCLEPRPHLGPTRFIVHSHNPGAANLMVMQIFAAGFQVEGRPFGQAAATLRPTPMPQMARRPTGGRTWVDTLRELARFLSGGGDRGPE
jgi:hypothetical protein